MGEITLYQIPYARSCILSCISWSQMGQLLYLIKPSINSLRLVFLHVVMTQKIICLLSLRIKTKRINLNLLSALKEKKRDTNLFTCINLDFVSFVSHTPAKN